MSTPSYTYLWRLPAVILSALLVFQGLAHAQTLVWTGDAGTSAWEDADNWDLDRVPEAGDVISLDGATVDLSTGDWEVGEVGESGGGTLNISGGSISMTGGGNSNYGFKIAINMTGGTLQTLGDAEFRTNSNAQAEFSIAGSASLIVGGDFRPHLGPYTLNGSGFSIATTDFNAAGGGDTINWNLDAQGIGAFTVSNNYGNLSGDWVFDLNTYDINNGTSLLLIDGPAGDTATAGKEPTTTFNFGSNPDILDASVSFDQPNGDYYLNITPIPEPSAWTLLLGTAGLLMLLRRRR